ncbi:MAG: hypothetical protein VZR53_00650 [Prevotella sp.]|nr:hypothetical protein [Prevotella sp.]
MKKNIKTKPAFIVDLTNIENCDDIKFQFIRAKATQGVAITEDDIAWLVMLGVKITGDILNEIDEGCEKNIVRIQDDKLFNKLENILKEATGKKKKPWYKRFWGWIKHPFKKNK